MKLRALYIDENGGFLPIPPPHNYSPSCYCPMCWRYTLKYQNNAGNNSAKQDIRRQQHQLNETGVHDPDTCYACCSGLYATYAKSVNHSPARKKKGSINYDSKDGDNDEEDYGREFKSPQARRKGPPGLSPIVGNSFQFNPENAINNISKAQQQDAIKNNQNVTTTQPQTQVQPGQQQQQIYYYSTTPSHPQQPVQYHIQQNPHAQQQGQQKIVYVNVGGSNPAQQNSTPQYVFVQPQTQQQGHPQTQQVYTQQQLHAMTQQPQQVQYAATQSQQQPNRMVNSDYQYRSQQIFTPGHQQYYGNLIEEKSSTNDGGDKPKDQKS